MMLSNSFGTIPPPKQQQARKLGYFAFPFQLKMHHLLGKRNELCDLVSSNEF
jgi:hypothetical protein